MTQLVHSNLHLNRSINLNGGDALHNFHRTKFSHLGISTYATRSITLLWILISRCSQVLVPSPQGDLRVVMRRNLVGIRTGPDTLTLLLRARRLISEQTTQLDSQPQRTLPFSTALTLVEVRVIRMRCTSSLTTLSFSIDVSLVYERFQFGSRNMQKWNTEIARWNHLLLLHRDLLHPCSFWVQM